jgi:polar amino acid transport system substrate-binding protein
MTKLDSRSPLGYSSAGVVLAVGAGVLEFKAGDRVACGGAGAAHAEVIALQVNLCVKIPAQVALDHAAFTTVGAIALQGIRLADVRLGEVVLVIGLGLLGQLAIPMLKASGCIVVGFDLNVERCKLACQSGADFAVASEKEIKDFLEGVTSAHGADSVLITAGTSSNKPVEMAGELCREQGKVVVVGAVGLTLPREPYYHKELVFRISRSYGPGRYDLEYEDKGRDYPYGYVRWTEKRNMGAFLALLQDKKLDLTPLITHRFAIEQADDAYALISGKSNKSFLGVLFEYQPQPDLSFQISVSARTAVSGSINIGVIGAGNFAQSMLLPHLKGRAGFSLKSVATQHSLTSRDVAERFGFSFSAAHHEEIMEDQDVHAVLIATRHDSHAALVTQALKAGKSIHVEKPLALTVTELDDIVTAYKAAQSQPERGQPPFLMVGFNRRFAPMVARADAFFSARTEPLAMLYRVNAGFLPGDHWTQDSETGGGRVIGEVCHFLDLLQFFAHARIKRIFAEFMPDSGKYHQDNLSINLSFEDGSIGTILYLANGDKSLPKEYIEIFSAGKVAVIDDYGTLTLIKEGKKKVSHEGARDKGHRAEMLAWMDALKAGKPEPVPFEHSVIATRASFAVLKSLQIGLPVTVNE